jgi:hypothetical protein
VEGEIESYSGGRVKGCVCPYGKIDVGGKCVCKGDTIWYNDKCQVRPPFVCSTTLFGTHQQCLCRQHQVMGIISGYQFRLNSC